MDSCDSQLVAKLKEGDQDSFTVLFEQYGSKVYSLAWRMCGNRQDAEDIVQKTFLQAFTNMEGFKEESSIYTWLYRIAKNLCLRLIENRKKSSFSSLDHLIQTMQSQEGTNDFTAIEKQFTINQVKDGCLLGLLRCLPFTQRIAFILHVLLDVKTKDVSAILNKPETAVRMLVYHAKQSLRRFLCKNCSLYNGGNPCQCENLIHFSIKQGWIREKPRQEDLLKPRITASDIEKEINGFKKIILLYSSLDHTPPETMIRAVQAEMSRQKYQIFCNKKVK